MQGHVHGPNCKHGHGHAQPHGHAHGGGHGHAMQMMHQMDPTKDAPVIPGMSIKRQTFARIVCPIAVCLITFAGYTTWVHTYSCNFETVALPMDGYLLTFLWFMTMLCFLRGVFASPGLVDKDYASTAKHTETHQLNREKMREQMRKQHEYMKRVKVQQQRTASEAASNGAAGDATKQDGSATGNNITIDMHPKSDEKSDDESKDESFEIPDHLIRPERSHYCYELHSNVLRMDHFCIWFNNAVGLRNYKFFFLTISYLFLLCVFTFFLTIYRLFDPFWLTSDALATVTIWFTIWRYFCIGFTLLISLVFSVFSAIHVRMHTWQIQKGLTSIEYHQFYFSRGQGDHFGIAWHDTHAYDHGTFTNIQKFLGTDWFLWWIPTTPTLMEDGYKYMVNADALRKVQEYREDIRMKREAIWKKSGLGKYKKTNQPQP